MAGRLSDVELYKLYLKWQEGAGAFRCFFRTTNFVSLKHYPDFALESTPLPEQIAEAWKPLLDRMDGYDPGETLFLLDLPGEEAVEAAFLLQNSRKLKPVLTFNNILHPYGLNGSRRYISLLVQCGMRLEKTEPQGYAFFLDQFRFGDYDEADLRKSFNNQYELTEEDLPSREMLAALGYRNIVYFCKGSEKEDIAGYLEYLADGGFSISKEEL